MASIIAHCPRCQSALVYRHEQNWKVPLPRLPPCVSTRLLILGPQAGD